MEGESEGIFSDNIKVDLFEIDYENPKWIGLAEYQV
jgi:hypothetical protein